LNQQATPDQLAAGAVDSAPLGSGAAAPAQRSRIKWSTVSFILLACVVLVATHGWSSWNARRVELDQAETETRNMAWALAGQANNSIKMVDTVLVGMVERAETDGMSPAAAKRLRDTMITHVGELSLLHGLSVYDHTGNWIVNSTSDNAEVRNNADRDYFRYHKTHTDRGPRVGAPIVSRTSKVWVIPVSRRINHPDGSFAGVALATIQLDFFRKFHHSVDVGKAGTVVLLLESGTLVLRTPFDASLIGRDVSNGRIFQLIKSRGRVGSAVLRSSVDGVERIYSYRGLPSYPLVVSVARSKEELLAEWRRNTTSLTVGLLLLIALLLTLGGRLVGQIEVRDRLERELREAKEALEANNASLTSLAFSDSLTGLANRRHFEKALEREFRIARRKGTSLALVMLDADYFKKYNDLYGHPAGDRCLRMIGAAIESGLRRPGDLASRYGGEEFAVLLPDTSLVGALEVAESIRAAVHDAMVEHKGNPLGVVTISAGACALLPEGSDNNPLKLVRDADRALYVAKSQGRNRVGTL
jgi:diguanylate cyclase (GGDEF)-like protein